METRSSFLFFFFFCFTPSRLKGDGWAQFTHMAGQLFQRSQSYFIWRVSLTRPNGPLYGVSLLHATCYDVGCFFDTPFGYFQYRINFPLHVQCSFMWGVSLTRSVFFSVGEVSYTHIAICMEGVSHFPPPRALVCGNILLHALSNHR